MPEEDELTFSQKQRRRGDTNNAKERIMAAACEMRDPSQANVKRESSSVV